MKRLRIYIDTSVVGGCLDEEFSAESRDLVRMAREGQVTLVVSDILADELELAPPEVQAVLSGLPATSLEAVLRSEEAERLRAAYLDAGVVPAAQANDALHVAIAFGRKGRCHRKLELQAYRSL